MLPDLRQVPEGLEVFVAASKTDRDAAGTTIAVPYGTHLLTCPVRTVIAYHQALAAAVIGQVPSCVPLTPRSAPADAWTDNPLHYVGL